MAFPKGTLLGSYEILELIGVGGMGEVYRANDLKLKREVALKVLPEVFARDPERVARFRREAQLLAQLNHPNIAAIYNAEESGGRQFLVMELVLGETLRERVKRGALPVEETLHIGKQIAEALEHAHEKPIMHRDLKPANVKVTPTGMVKVLDFGLAKAFGGDAANIDPHEAPTGSLGGTLQGTILGTPAYMSPEQASGKEVDKRADIWSFGCILYELLTGQWAFQSRDREGVVVPADTVQEIIARVLKAEPDWSALPDTTPPSIRSLLRRCLQKEAKKRSRDATEIQLQIEETITASATSKPVAAPIMVAPPRPLWRRAMPFVLTGLVVAAIAAGIAIRNRPAPAPQPVSRTVVTLSQGERLAGLDQPAVALSPDGTQLVYVASDSGGTQRLYLRPLDALQGRPLAGTEGASGPFFSPDGQWIGFYAASALKKVSVSGGATMTLSDAGVLRGASWGAQESIAFSPSNGNSLWQVPAAGGAGQRLTTLKEGETTHRWPEFLPGGKAILFTIVTTASPDDWQIAVERLDTGERKILVRGGTFGRYSPTGHLVYYRAGTMMAVPFDLARLEVTGTPAPVLEGVMSSASNSGAGQYSFSSLGSLVYVPGSAQGRADLTLAWVDRKGAAQPLPAPPRSYGAPILSPDGRLAAVPLGNDIWIYDLARDTLTRLTFEGRNILPRWIRDGKRVVYTSTRNGADSLFWRLADGSGPEERLFTSPGLPRGASFTPDSHALLFIQTDPKTNNDIWVLPLDGNAEARKPHVFLQTPFSELVPSLSPDGRWVAYLSNESGRYEVYVRPFPGPGGKWQISTEGGLGLSWSPKGNELFYRAGPQGEKLMAVDIQTQPTFSAGKPRLLFEAPRVAVLALGGNGADYSVAPDGQRFLMVKSKEQQQAASLNQINVVLNWFEELRRRVPAAK